MALALSACGEWKTDASALTARTAMPAPGPDCASCHAYPLTDRNHAYHLDSAGGNKDLNGEITCLDCHSQSIRFQAVTVIDSIYQDTVTLEKFRTSSHPNPGDTTDGGKVIRSLFLFGVETLPQHHPLLMPARPGALPRFQEYMTTLAHLNHVVDVKFDSRNSDPAAFGGDSATYNPTQESCSAVACHPGSGPKVYSWGSKAKGLPELKEIGEETP